jgi:hypothetical protein
MPRLHEEDGNEYGSRAFCVSKLQGLALLTDTEERNSGFASLADTRHRGTTRNRKCHISERL